MINEIFKAENGTRFEDMPNDPDGYRFDLHKGNEEFTSEWLVAATRDARAAAETVRKAPKLTPEQIYAQEITKCSTKGMRDDLLAGLDLPAVM